LKELALDKVKRSVANHAGVEVNGIAVDALFTAEANRYVLRFAEALSLNAGEKLAIVLTA